MRFRTGALVLLVAVALTLGLAPPALGLTVTDDFSADSGLWDYAGVAALDAGAMRLTPADPTAPFPGAYGQIWYKQELTKPFVASFRYKITGLAEGCDGLVFMFYKDKGYVPGIGGFLGFNPFVTPLSPVQGYGAEFDGYRNASAPYAWDTAWTGTHAALIEDTVGNHLAGINTASIRDGAWHDVVVAVGDGSIEITLDGATVADWTGTLDRNYGGLGIGAAAGGTFNDEHLIDDFSMTYDAEGPAITVGGVTDGGAYTAPVTVTFSATDPAEPVTVSATLNGAPFTSGSSVSAVGSYTLVVTATDGLGNESSQTITFSIAAPPVTSTPASSPWSVALGLAAAVAVIAGIARNSRKA